MLDRNKRDLDVVTNSMDVAQKSIVMLWSAAAQLAKGQIPDILSPVEIQDALEIQETAAQKEGLSLSISTALPLDVYTLPASVNVTASGD